MADQRDSYADVGQRMRQSIERAVAADVGPRTIAVLTAVFYWTASFSRNSDYISQTRLAIIAGIWKGDPDAIPKWALKRVSECIRELVAADAINYRAGGSTGRGSASLIGLPKVDEGSHGISGGDIRAHRSPPTKPPLPGEKPPHQTTPSNRERGSRSAPEGGANPLQKGEQIRAKAHEEGGADLLPHPRSSRERSSRGTSEDTRDTHAAVDRLASALRDGATVDRLPRVIAREAQRTAALVLDHLPAATVDAFVAKSVADSGPHDTPSDLLLDIRFLEFDGFQDQLEAMRLDPRSELLIGKQQPAQALADAVADNCGTNPDSHLEEALAVVAHWRAQHIHEDRIDDLAADARAGRIQLERPAHADRHMRTDLAALGLPAAPFQPGPARKIEPANA